MVLARPRCRDTREEAMRVEPDETFFLASVHLFFSAGTSESWMACGMRSEEAEGGASGFTVGLRRGREDEHVEGQAKNSESELHALHDGRTNLLVGGKEQIRWKRGSLAVARGAQEQCGGAEV